jgi:hypothetical protein
LVVNLSDLSAPRISILRFAEGDILWSIAPNVDDSLIGLFESSAGQKSIARILPESMTIEKGDAVVSPKIRDVIATDDKTAGFTVISEDGFEIKPKSAYSIPSPIQVYSDVVNGLFACQLQTGVLMAFSAEPKAHLIIENCQVFSKMWILPNQVIVCSGKSSANRLICLPKFAAGKNSKKTISELCTLTIPITPIIRESVVFKNTLYCASDSAIYCFSRDCVALERKENVDENFTEIFAVSDAVIASCSNASVIIDGKANIVVNRKTICVIRFNRRVYQVFQNGMKEIDGTEGVEFEDDVVAAGSNGFRAVVVDSQNRLTIFTKTFAQKDETVLELTKKVTLLCVCENIVVLGCEDVLLMFDYAMMVIGKEIPIPSPCTSICFLSKSQELLFTMANGAVCRCVWGFQTILDFSYIYFGGNGIRVTPIESGDSVMILDGRLIFYNEGRIVDSGVSDVMSCASFPLTDERMDQMIAVLTKRRELLKIRYDRFSGFYKYKLLCEEKRAVFIDTDEFLFVVGRGMDSFVFRELVGNIRSDEVRKVVTCCCGFNDFLVIGAASSELLFYRFVDRNFIEVLSVVLPSKPLQVSSFYLEVIVAVADRIMICSLKGDKAIFHRCVLPTPSPVQKFLKNGYVWAVFADKQVAAILYDVSRDDLCYVAVQKFSDLDGVSGIYAVDDLSVVICDGQGYMCLIRIPTANAHGYGCACASADYEVLGRIRLRSPLTSLVRMRDLLVYFTAEGVAGGFTDFGGCSEFRYLQEVQANVRRKYAEFVGMSVKNREVLAEQLNVVDLDVLDAFTSFPRAMGMEDEDQKKLTVLRILAGKRQRFIL